MSSGKSLVTGAAGFLGSHVCDCLLERGEKVIAVDDLSGGFAVNLPADVEWVKGDVSDHLFVRNLWNDHGPFNRIYHLAAYAAEGLSHFIRRFNYTNNLVASVNLLNETVKHGCECFVFTSSIAAYGSAQPPMREDTTPIPEDPYGIAKYAVELDLKSAHEMWGLNSVILRPHNVYGERQNVMDPYRNVVGIYLRCALEEKPFPVFGDGGQTRAFSYVGDVAPLIAETGFREDCFNEIFNVGSDEVNTVKHLAELIAEEFEVQLDIEWLEERVEAKHAYSDHSKLDKFFPDCSRTSLKEGISRMSDWVRRNGLWEASFPQQVEVAKGLPDSWRKLLSSPS